MPDQEQLRFSRRASDVGVILAWIQFPSLSPDENISLVETGKFVAENRDFFWREALGPLVEGYFTNVEPITGNVYYTTYNATPSGIFASSAISTGIATYETRREKTQEVSPSGFVIENFTSEVRVLPPRQDETGVWRLLVQDGVIVSHHILQPNDTSWLSKVFSPGDELVVYYSVPETSSIPYLHESGEYALRDARVVDVSGVVATVLDEKTIQLPDEDLYQIRSIKINNQEIISHPSGQVSISAPPPADVITAWEPLEGRFTINRQMDDDDEVIVAYRYREYLYTFEGYLDDNNVFHDLDLNPSPGHTYDGGRNSSELINIPIYVYLLPTAAYRVKDASGNVEQRRRIFSATRWTRNYLRWERTQDPISTIATVPVVDDCRSRNTFGYTYFGTAKFTDASSVDTLTAASTGAQTLANFPCAKIIAKIYITASAQVENVRVVDVRTRGGGIPVSTDILDPKLPGETKREATTYWDISGWDGPAVPLAGVVIVELPGDILTGSNNYSQFTQDEIEEIVKSHVASGIKVIVRYI